MRVSIIISVYNCLPLTQTCLETLERTVPVGLDHELVLVDDGSADGSRDFLKQYASTRSNCNVLLNERNLGYARSNNRGAELANGDVFLFLNNDTALLPGWVEPMLDGLNHKSRPGIVGNVQRRVVDGEIDHAGVFITGEGKPDHFRQDPATAFPGQDYKEFFAATGACLLMPAKVFRDLKGFDPVFRNGGEDMDLNFRVKRLGHGVLIANRSMIMHHVSASPGRNDHHERNTCILFSRWRDLLLNEGARQWSLDYLESHRSSSGVLNDPVYRQARLMKAGWRSKPPAEAIRAVEARMAEQERVWAEMFPGGPENY